MTLEQARNNVGRGVVYIPYKDCPKSQIEYGTITSVNDSYVFVRYGKDLHSKATRADDLKF
ncbi:MAG: hypothetical protein RR342_01330 [Bacilli bacterium]